MDARTFDKSKLPSRHVTEGPSRAPRRSYYYAMGLTEEQIHRPFVVGGPIALVQNGDIISIDAVESRLDLEVSEEERPSGSRRGNRPPIHIRAACCVSMRTRLAQRARGRSHMLAERRKLFAMRRSSGVLALALLVWVGTAAFGSEPMRDQAAQAALERGLAAYRAGSFAQALPALKNAASGRNETARFFAEFYMARIYADDAGAQTDHAKAYVLFRKLADENADMDPDDNQRAPFVAKAFIALAAYVRSGLPEIEVPANPRRAASYLHHAAIFFGDKDAQFELARLYLSGEGAPDDVRRGLHYLSTLSERSYPAAQALLAELFWKGRHVKRDERRALALITMAVESAPAHDRIWVEDTYHSIFCAATVGTRREADGIMARWRRVFARPVAESAERAGLGARDLAPERRCSNGETVAVRRSAGPLASAAAVRPAASAEPSEVMQGNAMPLGFQPVDAPTP